MACSISSQLQSVLSLADRAFENQSYSDAYGYYCSSLSMSADNPEGLTGKALCLFYLGRYNEAIPVFKQLLLLMPDSEQLSFFLAESLVAFGEMDQAEVVLIQLLRQFPDRHQALLFLGRLRFEKGNYSDSYESFSEVLRREPDNAEALMFLGHILIKYQQFHDAHACFKKAYSLNPSNIQLNEQIAWLLRLIGAHHESLDWYRSVLVNHPRHTGLVSCYLFQLNFCHGIAPEYIAAEHRRLASRYCGKVDVGQLAAIHKQSKIHVGYISGDFHTNSVSYFMEPILKNHDHKKFEVFCYSFGPMNDDTTSRLKLMTNLWRDVSTESQALLSEQIVRDGIHVLVDLTGHSGGNRLGVFAVRSAPVQVSWIGYPNTTGLSEMDYYITDNVCDPPGMTEHLYSERLWRLPRIFCSYLPPMEFPAVTTPPFKSNGYITFGSFNNFAKVTTAQISLWAQVLRRVPGSRLYLKSMALGDQSVRQEVLSRFESEDVEASRITMRVVTATPLEHLQEYGKVDISFDTFPYHGTTTTCEALWMGTPVITLCGDTHVSRVGVSLLQSVGCPDLVAHTPEDYVEKAVLLAFAPERLVCLRSELRGMMATSPLMDGAGVTRELEEAFRCMVEEKCCEKGEFARNV